jgi:putative phosphoesterase
MIYVFSDTHIPDRMPKLPKKLLDHIKPADLIIHAGDFVRWEVFLELGAVATVHAVRGNMDEEKIRRNLPEKTIVEIQGKRIGVRHGSGPSQGLERKVYRYFGQPCDVLIFGHSHVPFNRKIKDTLVFNPGSLAWNLAPPFGASYGILTIEGEDVWGEIIDFKRDDSSF